ncbi:MAG TPA: aminotransferase class V-fold PLP-dependent enzyme [Tepidisphaeraceae bacterium]|nr:aminotransferase class V-fold PLP-dependent enzyme [Tepidisphaeraceae bacterium]
MMQMDVVYLDNNATTRPAPQVAALMMKYLTDAYGNPSSPHRLGQESRKAIDEARSQLAGLVNCDDKELIFTGGGTEATNTAIRGLLATRAPRERIVISAVEHAATFELCRALAKDGYEVVEIPADIEGKLDLDRLKNALNDQTALASIMWANNETGVLFPVELIADICKQARVPFHCDATQAVGKIKTDFRGSGISLATVAAHKFHGPKGIGAIYLRRGTRLTPWNIGGPQEMGRRGGTENVPGIVGMGLAAELAREALPQMDRVSQLRDRLEREVLERISDTQVIGRRDLRLPNTTNIGFSRLEAEAILLLLSEKGVCASAGAACSSGSLEPSRILQAMGVDSRLAHGAIRFSLSRYTTDAEIDRALEVLPGVISRLRAVLPVGN